MKKVSIRWEILFLIFMVNLVMSLVYSSWVYQTKQTLIMKNISEVLTTAALATAQTFGDDYQDSIIAGKRLTKAEHLHNLNRLSGFSRELGLTYLYTMVRTGGGLAFSASSATEEEIKRGTYTRFMQRYLQPPPEVERCFQDKQRRIVSCSDEWGRFFSVFIPITTAKGNTYITGADISSAFLEQQLRDTLRQSTLIGLALFVFSSLVAFFFISGIAHPLRLLSRFSQDLVVNGFQASDGLKREIVRLGKVRQREVVELAEAISSMQMALDDYLATIRLQNQELEQKVEMRTSELHQKNAELEGSLHQLREAQDRLITQEKLASLGTLTAGIAHEIKNPLNFVNNFAQLSKELLAELEELLSANEFPEKDDIEGLIEDLGTNLTKIDEHGQRADRIVKGMLAHARHSEGERKRVQLNALIEEYVNLGYHGMRGQDSSFNLSFDKQYDPTIGEVEMIPQDFSRVILNLVSNACYALNQKKQAMGNAFSPVLTVTTRKFVDRAEIRVADNGTGISKESLDKVFDPFFTTKPTGEGTGLGLSISYDIITGSHGGTMTATSQEGEGTEFVISLPLQE